MDTHITSTHITIQVHTHMDKQIRTDTALISRPHLPASPRGRPEEADWGPASPRGRLVPSALPTMRPGPCRPFGRPCGGHAPSAHVRVPPPGGPPLWLSPGAFPPPCRLGRSSPRSSGQGENQKCELANPKGPGNLICTQQIPACHMHTGFLAY